MKSIYAKKLSNNSPKQNSKPPVKFASILIGSLLILTSNLIMEPTAISQPTKKQQVSKNKVTVSWYHSQETVFFEMSAPTKGWVTIGFNNSQNMEGTYLLMGRVKNGKVEVVEHYTSSPGNYQSIDKHGISAKVKVLGGEENEYGTRIRFSLPTKATSHFQKELFTGLNYVLTMAYSRNDDFQHHSTMRTSMNIIL